MQGCWRTDPFRHETMQVDAGHIVLLLRFIGYGQARMAAGPHRLPHARPGALRWTGTAAARRRQRPATTCSHWYADQLICQRGADNVAQCSGTSRGALGPTSWQVNLHKIN